jgi:hypothetical protein
MPLFIKLISCGKTPQNAGNSLSELQEIHNFLVGGCPQTPLNSWHLRCSTRLSQNPSYGPDLLPYYVYTYYLKHAIYAWFLQVPREICPPQLHMSKHETREILFLPLEHKIHFFSQPSINILYIF